MTRSPIELLWTAKNVSFYKGYVRVKGTPTVNSFFHLSLPTHTKKGNMATAVIVIRNERLALSSFHVAS